MLGQIMKTCTRIVDAKPQHFTALNGFNSKGRAYKFNWLEIWEYLPQNINCVRGKFNALDLRNISY